MPETAVRFYVRDYMLQDGFPSTRGVELVGQRMGWEDPVGQ
jgi:hypothetical protein